MLILSSFIQFTWTCYKKLTLGKKKKKKRNSFELSKYSYKTQFLYFFKTSLNILFKVRK